MVSGYMVNNNSLGLSGGMKEGLREGHGALYWKDGSYYNGEWVGDMKERTNF